MYEKSLMWSLWEEGADNRPPLFLMQNICRKGKMKRCCYFFPYRSLIYSRGDFPVCFLKQRLK